MENKALFAGAGPSVMMINRRRHARARNDDGSHVSTRARTRGVCVKEMWAYQKFAKYLRLPTHIAWRKPREIAPGVLIAL